METKICSGCKQEKPVSEFYKSKRDGYRSRCKVCSKMANKEYINRPEVRERLKGWRSEYYIRPEVKERVDAYRMKIHNDPEFKIKFFARNRLRHMVRMGRIIKEPCAICGKEQTEGHHPDYNQPLMVVWLCPDCHRQLHYSLKANIGAEKVE